LDRVFQVETRMGRNLPALLAIHCRDFAADSEKGKDVDAFRA